MICEGRVDLFTAQAASNQNPEGVLWSLSTGARPPDEMVANAIARAGLMISRVHRGLRNSVRNSRHLCRLEILDGADPSLRSEAPEKPVDASAGEGLNRLKPFQRPPDGPRGASLRGGP